MNGNNNIPDNSGTDNHWSKGGIDLRKKGRIDLRKEPVEFERRRKMVEEAKKLLLKAQKV